MKAPRQDLGRRWFCVGMWMGLVGLASNGCGGSSVVEDYSSFTSFSYSSASSELGSHGCVITRMGDTGYMISAYGMSSTNVVGSDRYLSSEEVERMKRGFQEVEVMHAPVPRHCEDVGSQTEGATWFVWDRTTLSTDECQEARLPDTQARALVELLQSLGARRP